MKTTTLDKVNLQETRRISLKLSPALDWKSLRSSIALLLVISILSYLTQGTFFTPRNLTNLSRQVAINGTLAVAMTFVILVGGIDLSIGSVVALAGIVAGYVQVNLGLSQWAPGLPTLAATLISAGSAVAIGLVCGLVNGWLITRQKITPFIITLGMMVIARGLALILSKGAAIAPLSDHFNFLGQGYLSSGLTLALITTLGCTALLAFAVKKTRTMADRLKLLASTSLCGLALWSFQSYRGFPVPVFIFGTCALFGNLILQKTKLGRYVFAIGGNPEAAWLAGVPIREITFGIYAGIGMLAGLCGAILSARLNGALPTAGELFELDAIAAVVIGGTSLTGGIGTVGGSIIGAFFMGSLNNGMSLLDVPEFYQKVIKGLVIILAVWFDRKKEDS